MIAAASEPPEHPFQAVAGTLALAGMLLVDRMGTAAVSELSR